MAKNKEAPGFSSPLDWPIESPAVCPGYLVTMPQVLEAARALAWKDSLQVRYEGIAPTGLLMDAIDVMQGAMNEVEAAMVKGK
jgi:hypothetical protein